MSDIDHRRAFSDLMALLTAADLGEEHPPEEYAGNITHGEIRALRREFRELRDAKQRQSERVVQLEAELEEIADLDRSALKHQELKDDRSRAVRMWHDEKKRADKAEAERDAATRRLHSVWLRAQSVVSVAAFQLGIDATDHAWLTVNADAQAILTAMGDLADDAA